MKRCEYCGFDIIGEFVTAYEEIKGNCSIIKREPTKEIGGKLRKIYYHKECVTK
jgi:hypothetical protein